jgi:Na+/proline symporter/nitrogen-specific signal transduction histidine kinase
MDIRDLAIVAALGFAALLFLVAFVSDRGERSRWLASPLVYTLSISIYCTSWTFYGAVGSAARDGFEYLTIYLGPTLVFVGFWTVLRRMLRIAKRDSITSIADFISSRYGKSDGVAALVTLLALLAAAPYIALQIKAIAASFQVLGSAPDDLTGAAAAAPDPTVAFWITAGLALFTILFGTRTVDIEERHFGVVAAIAVEALVKLVALVAVGILAIWGVADGPEDLFARMASSTIPLDQPPGLRWAGLMVLSAAAVLCLPRQFQVTIVENDRERHLLTAAWLFPLYLFVMSAFVLPIAVIGQDVLPPGSNPDMFVLTMPIAAGRTDIALLAFLGGFSSGTSMVIVSCIALSTMISNHIVMPLALRRGSRRLEGGGGVRRFLLLSRRLSICFILALGFLYLLTGATGAGLASIGLIAFAGAAQVMPALLAALYWEGANRRGALFGLAAGGIVWAYTLFLPNILAGLAFWDALAVQGPLGIGWLRPGALFGLQTEDALMHALFWSLLFNAAGLVIGSLSRLPTPIERLQAVLFTDVFREGAKGSTVRGRAASADQLFDLAQRIMGADRAWDIFRNYARVKGEATEFPSVDDAFVAHLERRLAASVGGASARAMILSVTGGETVTLDELVRIADETARLMAYTSEVTRKSDQIEQAAQQLRAANERLRTLDRQKDEFLSQVSHELRTPMTSIRSFTEILTETPDLKATERERFIGIIHAESIRLTGLLDEILDMSIVESGDGDRLLEPMNPEESLERALDSCLGLSRVAGVRVEVHRHAENVLIMGDPARLGQVFINILSNGIKYNTNPAPVLTVESWVEGENYVVQISDNGAGIPEKDAQTIFEKFARGQSASSQTGAGLGLAISRAIVTRHGGSLDLLPSQSGARFALRLPLISKAEPLTETI